MRKISRRWIVPGLRWHVCVWYTDRIEVTNAVIEAPKNFRRCNGLKLTNVTFPNAAETLWSCQNVELDHVDAKGDCFRYETARIWC